MKSQNVKFVDKYHNPTNVPQCRPIEDFFGLLTNVVYRNGWKADNLKQLQNRIRLCLRKFDMNIVKNTMLTVKKRLRKCALLGPLAVAH